MSDQSEAKFPLTLQFAKDRSRITFASKDEVGSWIDNEKVFWQQFSASPNNLNHLIQQNVRQLESLKSQASDSEIATQLIGLTQTYLPASGPLTRVLPEVLQSDAEVARLAFAMLYSPNAANFNQSAPQVIEAKVISVMTRALASSIGSQDRVESGLAEINRLRRTVAAELKRVHAQAEAADKEWKTRIEGYAARVALGAPRRYWRMRARKHQVLAGRARRSWNISLSGTAIAGLIAAALLFTPLGTILLSGIEKISGVSIQDNAPMTAPLTALTDFLRRAVVFGTILGIGLWWVRQKLRELRSHEHLAEDAAERVTMIETFAAMKGTELSPGDLSLVLSAIYRPSATGLIQDDGAPALPLEIAMKSFGDALARGGR